VRARTAGLPSSGKLSWATNTRERFRSWATDALSFVLSALHRLQQALQQQQQQQDTALTVRLLDALAAWVKLGLRSVAPALAEHTAHAGLLFVQSASPQVGIEVPVCVCGGCKRRSTLSTCACG
jgi:hypothetical protein